MKDAEIIREELAAKAENLYLSRQHLCADTLLLVFNDAFGGGLSEQQAVGLTSGLSEGQGGAGCLCGALGGGALVLGLFLSEGGAYAQATAVRKAVQEMHARFKAIYKSSCCRVLTKKGKGDEAAAFSQCVEYTCQATRIVADILLERRPELAERMDAAYVAERQSKARGILRRIFNRLFR